MKDTYRTLLAPVLILSLAPAALAQGGFGAGDDADGDGLPNELEARYGLNRGARDTDGDGASDALELAVGTDADDVNDVPGAAELNGAVKVNLLVYHDRATRELKLIAPTYWPEGVDAARSAELFAVDRAGQLGPAAIVGARDTEVAGESVSVFQADVADAELFGGGGLAMMVAVSDSKGVVAAEEATMFVSGNAAIHLYKHPRVNRRQSRRTIKSYVQVYVGGNRPTEGVSGAGCVIRGDLLGTDGPRIRFFEISDSGCELGFDSICTSPCSSLQGVVFISANPDALLP